MNAKEFLQSEGINDVEEGILYYNEDADHITEGMLIRMLEKYAKLKSYSEDDLIAAAKYGYEFRDTTSFPEQSFEDNCVNNVRQWIKGNLNKH